MKKTWIIIIILSLIILGICFFILKGKGSVIGVREDNETIALRKQVRDYVYEEYLYEECDLNNAKDYFSATSCENAVECLSERYSKLIPKGDLQDLVNVMAKQGGESGVIYYMGVNPSVKMESTYPHCLQGRHKEF